MPQSALAEAAAIARRDALLVELRGLAHAYPDDTAVCEQLAGGLLNTLNHAKAENALDRRDALLEELRDLARTYSQRCRPFTTGAERGKRCRA